MVRENAPSVQILLLCSYWFLYFEMHSSSALVDKQREMPFKEEKLLRKKSSEEKIGKAEMIILGKNQEKEQDAVQVNWENKGGENTLFCILTFIKSALRSECSCL